MVDLLPELVEAILSHIDDENELLKARRTCSVVSRTWSSAARPSLFSEVHIDSKSLSPDTDRGLISSRIVSESPHIFKWIKKLILAASLNVPNGLLADIARATTNLQLFNLSQEISNDNKLDPYFVSALPNTLSSIRLTTISLLGIQNFPVQLFKHCVALEQLTIKKCTFCSTEEPHETLLATLRSHPKSILLVTTTVQQNSGISILEWFLTPHCSFDLSQLQVLYVADRSDRPNAYEVVCQMVLTVSSTLTHLFLDPIAAPIEPPFLPFPAANLFNLQTLEMSITHRKGGQDAQWASDCLSHLPRPKSLTHFVLHYCTPNGRNLELYSHEFDRLAMQVSSPPFDKLQIKIVLYHTLAIQKAYMHLSLIKTFKASESRLDIKHVSARLYIDDVSLPSLPSNSSRA